MTKQYTDPCDKEYRFNCQVLVRDVSYEEKTKLGEEKMTTAKMVYLLPIESDITTAFLTSWLPTSEGSYHEIGLEIGHPVFAVFRGAVQRSDKKAGITKPHIFVMTRAVEDILKNCNGQTVLVNSLSQNDEDRLIENQLESDSAVKPL